MTKLRGNNNGGYFFAGTSLVRVRNLKNYVKKKKKKQQACW